MKANRFLLTISACALAFASISCSKQDSGSADVDMGVSDNGIILQTDAQSCVDVASVTNPPTRTLTSPVVRFGGFSIVWKSTTRNLYIGQIKITLKSPKITGGKYSGTLDAAEVEALLGATNSTLTKATDAQIASPQHGHLYASNSAVKEPAASGATLRACALGLGGVTLVDKDSSSGTSFTAQVTIDLIGTAFKPDDPTSEVVVRKSITTSATSY
jgi:hypothetical protein